MTRAEIHWQRRGKWYYSADGRFCVLPSSRGKGWSLMDGGSCVRVGAPLLRTAKREARDILRREAR